MESFPTANLRQILGSRGNLSPGSPPGGISDDDGAAGWSTLHATSPQDWLHRSLIAMSFGCRHCQDFPSRLGLGQGARGPRACASSCAAVPDAVRSLMLLTQHECKTACLFLWSGYTMVLLINLSIHPDTCLWLSPKRSPAHPVTEQHVALLGCNIGHGRGPQVGMGCLTLGVRDGLGVKLNQRHEYFRILRGTVDLRYRRSQPFDCS